MARKKEIQTFSYKCSISGEAFRTTGKAPNPDELLSVAAYYQMYPEKDDRPEDIKRKSGAIMESSE